MKTQKIHSPNGICIRYTLSSPKGVYYWTLVGITLILLTGSLFLLNEFTLEKLAGADSLWKEKLGIVCGGFSFLGIALLFARPCFQINSDLSAMRGFSLFSIPYWAVKIKLSNVATIEYDDNDPVNITIRCIDHDRQSIMAIEGFDSREESFTIYQTITAFLHPMESSLGNHIGDLSDYKNHLPPVFTGALLLLSSSISILYIITGDRPIVGTSLVVVMILAASPLLVAYFVFSDHGITETEPAEGYFCAWFRKYFIVRQHYRKSYHQDSTPSVEFLKKTIDPPAVITLIGLIPFLVCIFFLANQQKSPENDDGQSELDSYRHDHADEIKTGMKALQQATDKK